LMCQKGSWGKLRGLEKRKKAGVGRRKSRPAKEKDQENRTPQTPFFWGILKKEGWKKGRQRSKGSKCGREDSMLTKKPWDEDCVLWRRGGAWREKERTRPGPRQRTKKGGGEWVSWLFAKDKRKKRYFKMCPGKSRKTWRSSTVQYKYRTTNGLWSRKRKKKKNIMSVENKLCPKGNSMGKGA